MAKSALISYDYLAKNFPSFKGTIDPDSVSAIINSAQDFYLDDFLGTVLYEKIMDDIEASAIALSGSTGTLAEPYKTLVDKYVKPALLWNTAMDLVQSINSSATNIGNEQKNTATSSPTDTENFRKQQAFIEVRAGKLSQKLINHLCENENLYPELNQNNGADETNPIDNGYNNIPFNLGNSFYGKDIYKYLN